MPSSTPAQDSRRATPTPIPRFSATAVTAGSASSAMSRITRSSRSATKSAPVRSSVFSSSSSTAPSQLVATAIRHGGSGRVAPTARAVRCASRTLPATSISTTALRTRRREAWRRRCCSSAMLAIAMTVPMRSFSAGSRRSGLPTASTPRSRRDRPIVWSVARASPSVSRLAGSPRPSSIRACSPAPPSLASGTAPALPTTLPFASKSTTTSADGSRASAGSRPDRHRAAPPPPPPAGRPGARRTGSPALRRSRRRRTG